MGYIDYVILTHRDTDHVSGLYLIKAAKNVLVSEPEWIAANKPSVRYKPKMRKEVNVKPFKFKPTDIGPQRSSFDLFENGSVVLVLLLRVYMLILERYRRHTCTSPKVLPK
ncbi:MBL fold metallo-hydrolase [Dysgonomonas sp. 521]|uniref:MBL fold metallo-hydrolase n=1 Tax=Dysgonomonas sp. 521 TaxID=2302932 RepID=UPI0013D2BC3A